VRFDGEGEEATVDGASAGVTICIGAFVEDVDDSGDLVEGGGGDY
jgi:hypothetical protein